MPETLKPDPEHHDVLTIPCPDNIISSIYQLRITVEKTRPGSPSYEDLQFKSYVMNSFIHICMALETLLIAQLEDKWPDRIQR